MLFHGQRKRLQPYAGVIQIETREMERVSDATLLGMMLDKIYCLFRILN